MPFHKGLLRLGASVIGGMGQSGFSPAAFLESGGAMGAGSGQVASSEEGVAYSWTAGSTTFHRLTDGRIEVARKDGTIRRYRPYRPVVVPRKWDARSMRRVATALHRHRKTMELLAGVMGLKVVSRGAGLSRGGKRFARKGG